MCVHEARNTAGEAPALPTNDIENYVVVGSPAAFQAFKPPAMERTFL
jgi:hypothetical protein